MERPEPLVRGTKARTSKVVPRQRADRRRRPCRAPQPHLPYSRMDPMTEQSSSGTTPSQPVYPRVTSLDENRVPSAVRFPQIEERILKYWQEDNTFAASIENRPEEDEFVFYDGPPFANGLPHYGHLLTGYVKDLVPRYQTMRGKRVERR